MSVSAFKTRIQAIKADPRPALWPAVIKWSKIHFG
jgi:hypothetical protein